MICYETICREYATKRFDVPGSAIEVLIGMEGGRPFSVLVYDNRDASDSGHMHFGVWDLRALLDRRDLRKVLR